MKFPESLVAAFFLLLGVAERSDALIFMETADPAFHTTTPGDNSGWQYEGKYGYFLGVPIGPYHFITAKHFPITGPGVSPLYATFDFHGDIYTVIGVNESPSTDLRIVEVNHSKPFPTWAPIYTGTAEIGATTTLMGRGRVRGNEVIVSGETKGWLWGDNDSSVRGRWGRNVVSGIDYYGTNLGDMIRCEFDELGIDGECTVATGDSGGGWFILDNGLWRLAGITYGVEAKFRITASGSDIYAAIYDKVGLYEQVGPTSWVLVPEPDPPANVPTIFVGSRISSSKLWITGVTLLAATSLAPENFSAWQRLYFTPAEILTPATTGLLADYDKDGIGNLLECAFNLDPTFNERAVMTAGTGIRGLPLVRLQTLSGDERLTIEFVQRKTASGAGLTYTAQFSADLTTWSGGGAPVVTSINDRWERVKVTDTATVSGTPRHFGRVKVDG